MKAGLVVGAAAVTLTTLGHAQTVELRVREETRLTPVAGAIVRLLNQRGAVVTGLTDELGRIVLRAPTAGSYRIKIDRIGWTGLTTNPFEIGPGETIRREIRMASSRIELPEVVVRGRSQCGLGMAEGGVVSRLWEEIRKTLT